MVFSICICICTFQSPFMLTVSSIFHTETNEWYGMYVMAILLTINHFSNHALLAIQCYKMFPEVSNNLCFLLFHHLLFLNNNFSTHQLCRQLWTLTGITTSLFTRQLQEQKQNDWNHILKNHILKNWYDKIR